MTIYERYEGDLERYKGNCPVIVTDQQMSKNEFYYHTKSPHDTVWAFSACLNNHFAFFDRLCLYIRNLVYRVERQINEPFFFLEVRHGCAN